MDRQQADAIARVLLEQSRTRQPQPASQAEPPYRRWLKMAAVMWLGYFAGLLLGETLFDSGFVGGITGSMIGGFVAMTIVWRRRRAATD